MSPAPPPVPANEEERLAALRSLAILDTDPEQAFDDLVALAADLIHVPIALVSLVDEHRQWFKARLGLPARETPRELAFCAHAICDPTRTLEVTDARVDPRFADNPLVLDDPNIRFYAGAPLVTSDGFALGTLCVIDRSPRQLDEREQRALRSIADQVATQLELRRVVVLLDEQVSLRERSEQAARAAQAQAEEASRLKSDFLAMMSHEIRTPLNGVLGMTGVLLGTDLDPEQRRCAEVVRRSGESLLVVLNDLLDLSKIESGHLELEIVDFDLEQILRDVVDLSSDAAGAKGIELTLAIDDDVRIARRGDPFRLRQVLTNLVANAVKFTEVGSVELHASLALGDDGPADLASRLRFTVSDTGPGIDPDQVDHLFEPFTQADASVARRFGGTGLGLAICRQLVELQGGTIGAAPRAGGGSVFHVELPLGPATGPVIARARVDGPMPEAAGRTLLLAEDNPINQIVITKILEQLGFAVDVVGDGIEAVDAVDAHPYDLVLMDLAMPVLDGDVATQQLRAAGHTVPIIALTASALAGDRQRCLAAGMDDFLTKPVSGPALVAALEAHLPADPARPGARSPAAPLAAPEPRPAPVAYGGPVALVDAVAFGAVAALYGDGGLPELIDDYAREATTALAQLRAALDGGAPNEARRVAHRLAGSSATLGAAALAEDLRAIERAIDEGREVEVGAVDVASARLVGTVAALMDAAARPSS